MKWLELKIDAAPAGLDPVSALLEDLGITGLVIDDEGDFRDFLGITAALLGLCGRRPDAGEKGPVPHYLLSGGQPRRIQHPCPGSAWHCPG